MKNTFIAALTALLLVVMLPGQNKVAGQALNNATDSLSYCFGLLIGNNLYTQGVKDVNQEQFLSGFNQGYSNQEPAISLEAANIFVQDYFNKQVSEEANMNLEKSTAFLAENKTKEGVITTASGLQYKIITPGTGEFPQAADQVRVHYHGTFTDGKVFDSSIDRGEPIVFGVNQVIPGWTEALQLMQPGARWMLFIPPDLAYGENGAGGVIGPNMALVFEVELIEIVK
jgi:FKBP-type peptidyl-prolyl cis-trans isomerase FklB